MTKEALAARKLLDGRNFSQADCQRFGCGYAPKDGITWCGTLPAKASPSRRCSTRDSPVRASMAYTTISVAA